MKLIIEIDLDSRRFQKPGYEVASILRDYASLRGDGRKSIDIGSRKRRMSAVENAGFITSEFTRHLSVEHRRGPVSLRDRGLQHPSTGRRVSCAFGGWCLSIAALNWAFEVEALSSSRKFVLVALADYASECGTCWPSTETLCRKTCLDRKTVISALDDLLTSDLICDTGKRSGATAQIKVYRLKIPTESKSSKNGMLSKSKAPVFPVEGSQKRDGEGSQKRDTEPSVEPSRNHQGNGGSPALKPFERISAEKELDRIRTEKKSIRSNYDSHQGWEQTHRTRFKALKDRETFLRNQLGQIA